MKPKLKTVRELGNMDIESLMDYVEWLHIVVKEYQLIIDFATSKNLDLNQK